MLTVFGGSIPGGLKLQLGYVLSLGLLTWGLNLSGCIMVPVVFLLTVPTTPLKLLHLDH